MGSRILTYTGAVLLLVILARSFPRLKKVNRRVYSFLFIGGAILLIWSKAPLSTWAFALMKNANLVCLFTCAPMISLPFFYEDYQSELKVVAQTKMRSLLGFCLLVGLCSHLLGVLISVAALAIIYELLEPQAKLYDADDIFISSLTRGYSSSGFWSPAWASMILINSATSISWLRLIPIGIAFSILFILLDLATVKWKMHKDPKRYPLLTPEPDKEVHWPKIYTMLALAVCMISMIVILNMITAWDLMVIIPFVALSFPVISALFQRHVPEYKQGMKKYYVKSLTKVQVETGLYAAAGFLGKALQVSGIGEKLPELIPDWLVNFPVGLSICIMLIMILPAMLGIHPVVTGSALVAAIVPQSLGLTEMTFVLIIITGWLLSTMCSPFTATSTLVSGCSGKPPWDIGLGLNGIFGAAAMVIFSVIIVFAGPALG
ncbi:MAG: hypothetical protein VB085_06105 [Peptococcaceae bacterium]|nr:hypothetical protein [Peptococcaceae bacterium]